MTDEVSNEPLVIAREYEQLDIVTHRDDPKAGYIGWRIHWTGEEPDAYREIGARLAGGVYHYEEEPASYFLVETCSQQYSMYGTQVWRIEQGKVTHNAWFARNLLTSGWGSNDPAKAVKAVKELADVYIVAGLDGAAAIPPVDPDSLRVVESNNACCYLVY